VVIALAITEAVQNLVKDPSGKTAGLSLASLVSGLPACVAFLFTLVPFWHGMNRHLDRCYLEKPKEDVKQGALLLDFGVFFVEAGFLFAAAWTLQSGITSFVLLGSLLFVDMLWAVGSHQIHFAGQKSHSVRWALINLVALFLGVLIVAFPFRQKPWVLMALAVVRTVLDYGICYNFYFPAASTRAESKTASA
jgi:hypothetical protein